MGSPIAETGSFKPEKHEDRVQKLHTKIVQGAKAADSSPPPCIYRVPEELRKLKESAYTPRVVSIGPLHSKDKHLSTKHMKHIKRSYVNCLLCRIDDSPAGKNKVLEECVKEMEGCIDDAKKYYGEKVDALDVEMLVIDGCFILELFHRCLYGGIPNTKDPIFDSSMMYSAVQHDLILLENQLPFFVLEKMFKTTVVKIPIRYRSPALSLPQYVLKFFSKASNATNSNPTNCCWPSECVLSVYEDMTYSDSEDCPGENSGKVFHILHLLHSHYLPRRRPKNKKMESMPTASDLEYAGVKFVPGAGEDLLMVKYSEADQGPTADPEEDRLQIKFREAKGLCWWFCRARFEIPTLSIYDSTEQFLRNLIAFENCCSDVPTYITSYAFLMDTLIDTEKDVKVLQKAGIIRNFLGASEEASVLFNNLCKEVVLREFYFETTCKKAAAYSERCWPKFMAHLRREYIVKPWTIIAFIVAFLAFGMSVTNFVRGFLPRTSFGVPTIMCL